MDSGSLHPPSSPESSATASGSVPRSKRVRSRTSTLSFVNNLPPVMSRDNSREDLHHQNSASQNGMDILGSNGRDNGQMDFAGQLSKSLQDTHAGPSSSSSSPSSRLEVKKPNRPASKSISSTASRPTLNLSKRTQSYHNSKSSYSATPGAGPSSPSPNLMPSPSGTPGRNMLKRRTSTPSLAKSYMPEDDELILPPSSLSVEQASSPLSTKNKGKDKATETRARSTSTSIAYPPSFPVPTPTLSGSARSSSPLRGSLRLPPSAPQWSGLQVTPASPDEMEGSWQPPAIAPPPSFLSKAKQLGETSITRLAQWVKPGKKKRGTNRRTSEDDSEKGMSEEDGGDPAESLESVGTTRTSVDSFRAGQGRRFWGFSDGDGDGEDDEDGGYFSLPPTPPEEKDSIPLEFAAFAQGSSLPTPALSTRSLSKPRTSRRRQAARVEDQANAGSGWLRHLLRFGSGTKTGQVIRDLGWTVGMLAALFFVTGGIALWMIKGMPITTLKHLPQSTTDLQLLSAEIRAYMNASDAGWYHTIGVLTFVGCWKHAWSVPGAVVLNILVGSVLEPTAALALLTVITATGSLGSYLLSRPLAPLIAVLFPKPLALVQVALAPETIPSPPSASQHPNEHMTPVQVSSNPADPPIGVSTSGQQAVWRRLLVMRAMGIVPWSGMNVACGVVGVNWRTFWLTTAAGSASWSYVTASVGNILSRLALPKSADGSEDERMHGESLTSLLRDPVLIAKLVFLTGLTLLPVIIKRRSTSASTTSSASGSPISATSQEKEKELKIVNPALANLRGGPTSPPMSPITQSLARFTPTPAVFDLLSFGRTALRQGGRLVNTGLRGISEGAGRAAAAVRG